MNDAGARWRIAVDTGGTFTDCVALDPAGREHRVKVLSRSALRGTVVEVLGPDRLRIVGKWGAPEQFVRGFQFRRLGAEETVEVRDFTGGVLTLAAEVRMEKGEAFEVLSPEEAPILAARLVTGCGPGDALPPMELRVATTRGTNALLEEKGAEVAFFVTEGFPDLLRIGTQQRPDLFALEVRAPEPLPRHTIEVRGRLRADGTERTPLDLAALEGPVRELRKAGCTVAAVALLHSYAAPGHERRLAEFLRERGFEFVSVSSELAPFIKLLPRAETAVVDAYLSPVMRGYLDRITQAISGGSPVFIMNSSGGLVPESAYRAKDSLLSGPAGGVTGAASVARRAGFGSAITFDMGGTSTDVSRWAGQLDYQFQHTVGRARLLAPALKIETVAAGGGSVCAFEGGRLRVGPESAGAQPGPACYGAGGPLTITDVNLLLDRLDALKFGLPLDREAAERAAEKVQAECGLAREEMLRGFLEIAHERMAGAIEKISVREGYDPAASALVAFGGAGGQHACAIAERLGMATVLCPADAGLLSAAGLREALVERFAEEQVLRPLDEIERDLKERFLRLATKALDELRAWDIADGRVRRRIAQLRLAGQETPLDIEGGDWRRVFGERYRAIYGYAPGDAVIEVVALRVVVSEPGGERTGETFAEEAETVIGPAVIQDEFRTVVVEAGWSGVLGSGGTWRLSRSEAAPLEAARSPRRQAIDLELFTHRFETLVEEMGVLLQRTALSTNIKERFDFSCALLDAGGELIVNAPHIPVHLGAIGMCVREVAARYRLRPGDMIVTNDPAVGGSHLPDITVISPVFQADGALAGYVANRGHHAEIGGLRAGSMSPEATRLPEEGVVIAPQLLFENGEPRFENLREVLEGAPYPSRAVADNLADLRAQAAANLAGVAALERLLEREGPDRVAFYMAEIKSQASLALRSVLLAFPDGSYAAEESLDDGTRITLRLTVRGDALEVDFTGTDATHPANLNATPAIVNSVLIYVLRLWIGGPLPLNEGLLNPVTVHLPRCFLNPDFSLSPAVSGGNVEVSQRLVDTFLKALGLAACSQGTMNNLIFGNERLSYYETIGGGCGAGPGFHGASGLHSHMTNTAITDPEIFERRYPVMLERYALRAGSGGRGEWRGGEGVERIFRFEEPVSLSLLTQHRHEGPYGGDGGHPGTCGEQWIERSGGSREPLPAVVQCQLAAGDCLVLRTPGGGGWGRPGSPEPP